MLFGILEFHMCATVANEPAILWVRARQGRRDIPSEELVLDYSSYYFSFGDY